MAKFKILFLTQKIEDGNVYWLQAPMSEFYSQKDELAAQRQEYNMLNTQHTFCYTFNEQYSISENSQKTLTFSMTANVMMQDTWQENPFIKNVHIGSFILLIDKYDNESLFIVKNIDTDIGEDNTTYSYSCEDAFTYQMIRQNDGYNLENDYQSEDFIGAKTLDWWVVNKIVPECKINYSYLLLKDGMYLNNNNELITFRNSNDITNMKKMIKYPNNDAALQETFPFSASGSNADAVLISLGETLGLDLKIYEKMMPTKEGYYLASYFWFAPKKNTEVTGLKYSPTSDIKDFSISYKGDSLTTVLNVTQVSQPDDSIVTLLPTVPAFFTQYFMSSEWDESAYYEGMFSDIVRGEDIFLTTEVTDESNAYAGLHWGEDEYYTDSTSEAAGWLYKHAYDTTKSPTLIIGDTDSGDISAQKYLFIPVWSEKKEDEPFLFDVPLFYDKVTFQKMVGNVSGFINMVGANWSTSWETDNNNASIVFCDDKNRMFAYNAFTSIDPRFIGKKVVAAIRIPISGLQLDIIEIQMRLLISFTRDPSDEEIEFAEIADQCPWLENKIIDLSYYYTHNIINKQQYFNLMNILQNQLRITNGKLLVYSQEYYNALHHQTEIIANLTNQVEQLGASALADIITPYKEKSSLPANLTKTPFANDYNLFFTPPTSTTSILNYNNLLAQYFENFLTSQQLFFKNIYNFRRYFNSPVAFNSDGIFEDIITLQYNPDQYFISFERGEEFSRIPSPTNPDDTIENYYDTNKQSNTYGKPFFPVYDENHNLLDIISKDRFDDTIYQANIQKDDLIKVDEDSGLYKNAKQYYAIGIVYEDGTELDESNAQIQVGAVISELLRLQNKEKPTYIFIDPRLTAAELNEDVYIFGTDKIIGKSTLIELKLSDIEYIWLSNNYENYYTRNKDFYIDVKDPWSNFVSATDKYNNKQFTNESISDNTILKYINSLLLISNSILDSFVVDRETSLSNDSEIEEFFKGTSVTYVLRYELYKELLETLKTNDNYYYSLLDGKYQQQIVDLYKLYLPLDEIYYYGKVYKRGNALNDISTEDYSVYDYFLLNTDNQNLDDEGGDPLYDYQSIPVVNIGNFINYFSRIPYRRVGLPTSIHTNIAGISLLLDNEFKQGNIYLYKDFNNNLLRIGKGSWGLSEFPITWTGFHDEIPIIYSTALYNYNLYSIYKNIAEENYSLTYYNYFSLIAPTFSGIQTLYNQAKESDSNSGIFYKATNFRPISKDHFINNKDQYKFLISEYEDFREYFNDYNAWLNEITSSTSRICNNVLEWPIYDVLNDFNTSSIPWDGEEYMSLSDFVSKAIEGSTIKDTDNSYVISFTINEKTYYIIVFIIEDFERKDIEFDLHMKLSGIYSKLTDTVLDYLTIDNLTTGLFTRAITDSNFTPANAVEFDINNGIYYKKVGEGYIRLYTIKQAPELYIISNNTYKQVNYRSNITTFNVPVYLNQRKYDSSTGYYITVKDNIERIPDGTWNNSRWSLRHGEIYYSETSLILKGYSHDYESGISTYTFLSNHNLAGYNDVTISYYDEVISVSNIALADVEEVENILSPTVIESRQASTTITFIATNPKGDGTVYTGTYEEDGVTYTYSYTININTLYQITGLTNGAFWFLFHNLTNYPTVMEHAALIESELTAYWTSAYAQSLYIDYFIPENWQNAVEGIDNGFSRYLYTIINEDKDNNIPYQVNLRNTIIPEISIVSNGNTTVLPNYNYIYNNSSIEKYNTTQQWEVNRENRYLLPDVNFNNPVIESALEALGETDLSKWTVIENGTRVYYEATSGGLKWNKLVDFLGGTNNQFNQLDGIYPMFYKKFKQTYIEKTNINYNYYNNIHQIIWTNIYKTYPGIILESTYSNEDATSSKELLNLAQFYMKDLYQPEKNYNISLIDLAQLKGYEGQELHIGDGIELNYAEYNTEDVDLLNSLLQYLFITDISYSLRDDSEISITVNVIKYQEKLIQNLVKLIR